MSYVLILMKVHTHITNICTKCSSVVETCNENMGLNLKESTKNMGVALTPDINVEILFCALTVSDLNYFILRRYK